jgi:outer membrane receptor for ferrienterochelin and colicins
VWLQHRWRAVDAVGLALLTGMRLDLDSRFGVAPAPRVAVRLVPHDRLTLRVAGGLGYRAPDFKQLFLSFSNPAAGYRVAGNPDLEPERSVGGNVDVELRAHRDLTLTVSAWHDAVRGLITTDLVAEGGGEAVYGYVNVGRARLQGLAAALYVAPARPVSLALTYTLTDADDLERQRPLPGRAEHQGGASLRGAHEALAFGGSVSAVVLGPRPFYPGDGLNGAVVHPTTAFLDARAWWRPTAAVELFVGVDNLLDAGVPDLDAARPRRAYGGLTVRLRPPDREAVRPTPIAGVR